MKTINVTERAADIVEALRTDEMFAETKAGIADLFAFALSDVSNLEFCKIDRKALETLCDLNELINELAHTAPEADL